MDELLVEFGAWKLDSLVIMTNIPRRFRPYRIPTRMSGEGFGCQCLMREDTTSRRTVGQRTLVDVVVSLAPAEFPSVSLQVGSLGLLKPNLYASLNYDPKERAMLTGQVFGNARTVVNTFVLTLLLITDAARSSLISNTIYETCDRGRRDSDILTNGQFDFHYNYTNFTHLRPAKPLRLHADVHVIKYC